MVAGLPRISGPKRLVDAISQELNVAADCSNYEELPALGFELLGFLVAGSSDFNLFGFFVEPQ